MRNIESINRFGLLFNQLFQEIKTYQEEDVSDESVDNLCDDLDTRLFELDYLQDRHLQ